jgi:hypothetical protein
VRILFHVIGLIILGLLAGAGSVVAEEKPSPQRLQPASVERQATSQPAPAPSAPTPLHQGTSATESRPPVDAAPPVDKSAATEEPIKPLDHATIAVLGDSLADGLWGGLVRQHVRDKRYTMYRGAKNSVGFGGDDLIEMIDTAFAKGKVDAVVMMIGANDRRGIYVGGSLVAPYKSPQWPHAYQARAQNFMDAVIKRGVPLVWVLLPVMHNEGAEADSKQINQLIRQAAVDRPAVTLLESRAITSEADGAFAPYMKDPKGQARLVRHTDGVHFSDYGYELITTQIFAKLNEISPPFGAMVVKK